MANIKTWVKSSRHWSFQIQKPDAKTKERMMQLCETYPKGFEYLIYGEDGDGRLFGFIRLRVAKSVEQAKRTLPDNAELHIPFDYDAEIQLIQSFKCHEFLGERPPFRSPLSRHNIDKVIFVNSSIDKINGIGYDEPSKHQEGFH